MPRPIELLALGAILLIVAACVRENKKSQQVGVNKKVTDFAPGCDSTRGYRSSVLKEGYGEPGEESEEDREREEEQQEQESE